MAVFHSTAAQTIAPIAALERLEAAISQVRGQHEGNFERLERELHALFVTAERELLGEELERLDIDVPSVLVEGEVHHRVLRGTETYTSAAGPVTVTRSLYRSGKSSAVVPMELRAGMVAGHWTPLAARQALWVVTHLAPGEGGKGCFASWATCARRRALWTGYRNGSVRAGKRSARPSRRICERSSRCRTRR